MAVTSDSSHLTVQHSTAEKWIPLSSTFPVSLTLLSVLLIVAVITSDQLFSRPTPLCLSSHSSGLSPDLLKSVPVSWARMRKERDCVVPVRGCQSSVSSISLFLLRSLGIKQGMFSALRPCLHAHTPSSNTQQARLTQSHRGTTY